GAVQPVTDVPSPGLMVAGVSIVPGANRENHMHALPNCADADALEATLCQIHVMRCYATESGKPINDELAALIAQLASLCRLATPPADGTPPPEVQPPPGQQFRGRLEDYEATYRLALEVHRLLSALIHPANPATIVSTDFTWRIWKLKTVRPLQWLLIAIAVLTLAATLAFTYATFELNTQNDVEQTVAQQAGVDGDDLVRNVDSKNQAGWVHDWRLSLQFFAAAMLGAGFATLLNAAPFVVHRSFDNRYITVYLLRYLLGVVAGVILGLVGPDLIEAVSDEPPEGLTQLSLAVLAIVGGFSANAVAAILTRISDTLVALVRGRNEEPREEVERRINDRVDAERQRFNATQATKISDILAKLDQDPDIAREALRAMIGKP
ncbi:MAG: hypothetical protein AAF586_06705, partial [Planctomycetota bacterium]